MNSLSHALEFVLYQHGQWEPLTWLNWGLTIFRKFTLAKNSALLKFEVNGSTMELTRQLSIIVPSSWGEEATTSPPPTFLSTVNSVNLKIEQDKWYCVSYLNCKKLRKLVSSLLWLIECLVTVFATWLIFPTAIYIYQIIRYMFGDNKYKLLQLLGYLW